MSRAAGAWLTFSILYVAAYAALLNPQKWYFSLLGAQVKVWSRVPNYRWASPVVEKVFSPIHRLDQLIRPRYWSGSDPNSGFQKNSPASTSGGFGGGLGGHGFGGSTPRDD